MKKLLPILSVLMCIKIYAQTARQPWEVRVMHCIHKDSSKFEDRFYRGISPTVVPVGIAAPTGLILAGFINKDEALKRDGYRAGATFILNSALTVGIKYSIRRTRPFKKCPDLFCNKARHVGPLSFPSGHTSTAFATATSLTLATKKWYVAVPAYAWASGVAYSRMYLGVHYPSDILGGMVIGIGSSFLVWKVDQWLQKK
ncbi:MAG TPA: phosphatase PAP2 family protein [Bacteroidia bacterium]